MNSLTVNQTSSYLSVARTVVAFWLLGWLIKAAFFKAYLFKTIIQYPVVIDFFPTFFRSALTAEFFYVLPLIGAIALISPKKFYLWLAACTMVVSSLILLWHQDTYNDATFVTSFWVSVWLLWFVSQMHRRDDDFPIHARSLALCVVGLIFWGGFVGKLTQPYWDGRVLADIFMVQNYGSIGGWVRTHVPQEVIRLYFQWISKVIILGEACLACLPFWPNQWSCCWIGIPFMIGISIFTTWRIFSVLLCLIGLLVAAARLKTSN
jgi:hypothetical protein